MPTNVQSTSVVLHVLVGVMNFVASLKRELAIPGRQFCFQRVMRSPPPPPSRHLDNEPSDGVPATLDVDELLAADVATLERAELDA
jgi:hypothetical protein